MYKYIRTGEEARRRFEGFAEDSGIQDAKTQAGDSYLQVGPANLYGGMNLGNLTSERLQRWNTQLRPRQGARSALASHLGAILLRDIRQREN